MSSYEYRRYPYRRPPELDGQGPRRAVVIVGAGFGGLYALHRLRGMGLKRGALAGTVAHDHHNVLVVGADDLSMRTAVDAVALPRSKSGLLY